ncbi:MAG: DUF2178 domain-containing protein [Candidatus Goldbacteria bacterium]|nr:DUF2178 domain-containing protein [Candidatus Goldiibacteriota bacterium]
MNSKKYRFAMAIVTTLTAAGVGAGVILHNYLIPLFTLAIGVLLVIVLKRHIKELVMEDERIKQISAFSARAAVTVFSNLAALTGIVLLAFFGKGNNIISAVGYTLCFSTCFILLVDLAVYFYLDKKQVS